HLSCAKSEMILAKSLLARLSISRIALKSLCKKAAFKYIWFHCLSSKNNVGYGLFKEMASKTGVMLVLRASTATYLKASGLGNKIRYFRKVSNSVVSAI